MSSVYAKFIAANEALFKCMEATSADQYNAMSAADQANVCKSEASEVASYLQNNSVNFRSLLNERIDSLAKQQ